MTDFLTINIFVLIVIIVYAAFIAFFDRKHQREIAKKEGLISIVLLSSGAFISWITSAVYLDGWKTKYLLPVLVFAFVTSAMIIYAFLIKKIYARKKRDNSNE